MENASLSKAYVTKLEKVKKTKNRLKDFSLYNTSQ